jgi:hypothetical protein
MHRFLVDEDMPRSTARVLRGAGYEAEDVRDVGLRGHSDADETPSAQLNDELLRVLAQLRDEPLAGCLVIVELGRIRMRRP